MTPRKERLRRQNILIIICLVIIAWSLWSYRHPAQRPKLSVLVTENFPLAASADFNGLPPVPAWNKPPKVHVPENTPLFIGFSQNWPLLQEAVVSYLTAGWPASDIYIVDNTGTMLSNRHQRLSLQNPAYLNYSRLENIFQVNVILSPTLLTFSQLQNFFLFEALQRNWTHYFWSHMDVAALSVGGPGKYKSLYLRVVEDFRLGLQTGGWASRLYAYDRLSLVSVSAFETVGGWDTSIPYYPSDCDMYSRLDLAGFVSPSPSVGQIFDVSESIEDLEEFYLVGQPGSQSYENLFQKISRLSGLKNQNDETRNTWQGKQRGGHDEPFYYQEGGREISRQKLISLGRWMFKAKWGSDKCRPGSRRSEDAWVSVGRWWWW